MVSKSRWVVQYLGNPQTAIRELGLGMGEAPSDSEKDDFIRRHTKALSRLTEVTDKKTSLHAPQNNKESNPEDGDVDR